MLACLFAGRGFECGVLQFTGSIYLTMVSPIIICDGVIRSGSTWSFNVCRLLAQMLAERRCETLISHYLDEQQLDQFLRAEVYLWKGPAVVKGHVTGPLALEWIRTGRAKGVCTFRDPRDCVASDVSFFGGGFNTSLQRVNASLASLASYLDFGRTLFIRYEEMMDDRPGQIRRIAAHLNIAIDQKDLERVDEQTNIHSARKIAQQLASRADDQIDTVLNTHRRDLKTLLHDNHIGTGKVGKWKQDLTDEQGQQLTQLFRRSLLLLGYETEASLQALCSEALSRGANLPDSISAPPC
jgi:hypothetical protein